MGSERRSASTEPIRRDDCVAHVRGGEKPAGERRVGLEVERLGVLADGSPLPIEGPAGVLQIVERIASRHGLSPRREGHAAFGLDTPRGSFSLEPGGQVEISTLPRGTFRELRADLESLLGDLREASRPAGARWLPVGLHPFAPLDGIGWIPRERYRIMSRRLGERGDLAHRMMKQTASVQVNLDFTSEEEAVSMMEVAMRLDSIALALLARSPLCEGRVTGEASTRGRIWTRTDPDRCGLLQTALEGRMGYAEWVDWAFGVPLLFLVRDGRYREVSGMRFGEFVERGFDGERAVLPDWEVHLTTLFPEARLKTYLEVRGADGGGVSTALAVGALWAGLLYSADARREALALVRGMDPDGHRALHEEAILRGLDGRSGPVGLREAAREMVQIASEALAADPRHGGPEWLDPLGEILDRGESPAAELLRHHADSGGDPEAFVARFAEE